MSLSLTARNYPWWCWIRHSKIVIAVTEIRLFIEVWMQEMQASASRDQRLHV